MARRPSVMQTRYGRMVTRVAVPGGQTYAQDAGEIAGEAREYRVRLSLLATISTDGIKAYLSIDTLRTSLLFMRVRQSRNWRKRMRKRDPLNQSQSIGDTNVQWIRCRDRSHPFAAVEFLRRAQQRKRMVMSDTQATPSSVKTLSPTLAAAASRANVGAEPRDAAANTTIRPFRVNFPQTELDDLRQRVLATRWPEKEPVNDHSQGVPLATMRKLAHYWVTEYDWRKVEAKLNALPNFITEIDGLDIHFIHVR